MVRTGSLTRRFGSFTAVDSLDLVVQEKEIFGLLGPNGAGKTTTIRIILDIFKADKGSVSVLGGSMSDAKKDRIGYMPEERGLYKDGRLDTTLIYLATLKGMDEQVARNRLGSWLERFELAEHRKKKVQELSKGMQQKAQLIATLLHEPALIVIDEPFSGLDPVSTRLVKQIFEEQRQAGSAILMSTHQMYQAEALCARIVLIDRGRTVLYGGLEEIKHGFAGNAVLVTGQGDFTTIPGVLEARHENGDWRLALEAGTDPQAVFRALAGRPGVKIERFELAEPSLDDIFISVVQGGAPAEGGGDA